MELFWRLPIPNLGTVLTWLGTMLSSLGVAYLFYVAVERPSHRLARRISTIPLRRAAVSEKAAYPSGV
jgi:peptidoglycan/LPS O-acetylase OafA/YrhL